MASSGRHSDRCSMAAPALPLVVLEESYYLVPPNGQRNRPCSAHSPANGCSSLETVSYSPMPPHCFARCGRHLRASPVLFARSHLSEYPRSAWESSLWRRPYFPVRELPCVRGWVGHAASLREARYASWESKRCRGTAEAKQQLSPPAERTLCSCRGQAPDVPLLASAVAALARTPCGRPHASFLCASPLAPSPRSVFLICRLLAPGPDSSLVLYWAWFAASLRVLTPKPIGANAGLSTAPASAICRNNVSVDRL